MPEIFDTNIINRFRMVKSELERVVEEHLPGDFANWEEQHTSWRGDIKTIDSTSYDPRAMSCAWGLFIACDKGAEYFGRPEHVRDIGALNDLEQSLTCAKKAINEMSSLALYELTKTSGKAQATVYDTPARLYLKLAIQDGLASIPDAINAVEEKGAPATRRKMRAAAVVNECRKVYEARTGRRAPRTARDQTQKKSSPNGLPLFNRFTLAVFKVLGIRSGVAGPLAALKKVQELDAEKPANS